MSKRIKMCANILVVVTLIMYLNVHFFIVAEATTTNARDDERSVYVTILVDETGSMRRADPNRITLQGVMLFADLMGVGSSIAVIGFAEEPRQMNHNLGNFRTLYDFNDYRDLIEDIQLDVLRYQAGWTDIRAAVARSVEMMAVAGSATDRRAVILFTDGQNEFRDDPNNELSRIADEESLEYARRLFVYYNADLFIVALNADGSINQEFLEDMIRANGRGLGEEGEMHDFLTIIDSDSIEMLPEFFQNVFARLIGTRAVQMIEKQNVNEITFNVETRDAAVQEINIIVLPQMGSASGRINVESIESPNARGINQLGHSNIYVSEQDMYTLIKIIRDPSVANSAIPQGEWTIRFGNIGSDVYISVFAMRNENIRARVHSSSRTAIGVSTVVTAEIFDGNNMPFSAGRRSQLQEHSVIITSLERGQEHSVPLVFDSSLGRYVAEWIPEFEGVYFIHSRFVEDDSVIESSRHRIDVIINKEELIPEELIILNDNVSLVVGDAKPISSIAMILPSESNLDNIQYYVDGSIATIIAGELLALSEGSSVVRLTLPNGETSHFNLSVLPMQPIATPMPPSPEPTPEPTEPSPQPTPTPYENQNGRVTTDLTSIIQLLTAILALVVAILAFLERKEYKRRKVIYYNAGITINNMSLVPFLSPFSRWIKGRKIAEHSGIKPDSQAVKLRLMLNDDAESLTVKGVSGIERAYRGTSFTVGNLYIDIS